MMIRRVALIYDDRPRPETTGYYCRRALESLVEVVHFRPDELADIPRPGFDLYLNIDDSLFYHLPTELHPAIWWAIDTHLNFARSREKSLGFDLVFAAQRDGAEQLRRDGITSAVWLPLGCDPDIHRKHDVAKQFDVGFVGHIFPGPRAELLELIRRRYRRSFIGNAYFDEMARTYSAARMAFNRSIRNDVNMRIFEAVACGSMLVTNDLADNGQGELFRDGMHLATYRDAEELLDKLAFYLGREELRERIAAAGRAEAVAKHTYLHRMERLLREAEEALGRSSLGAPTLRADGSKNGGQAPGPVRPGRAVDPVAGPEVSPPIPQAGVEAKTEAGDRPAPPQQGAAHDPFYFGHARPEVLELIPLAAQRALDIGCGAGRLGEAIKARQQADVVGIELDEAAAAVARRRLDAVLVGDVERMDLELAPGSFDVIVCADLLEHLREPDRLLRKARDWLAPDGRLVVSIPNVRHHLVVRSLLEGNWTYASEGLLDRTHLRFFTRREIEKLFYRSGFAIDGLRWSWAPGESQRDERPGEIHVGRLHIGGLPDAEADEFHAYQYLVRAHPADVAEFGLTSIVIVTHNQLEYTRLCLDSLWGLTDEPYELIVVDNGSSDGTVEYLGALPGVRLIVNDANRGFPVAANQGITAATGSQILLLNNDVVVTTGWLRRLLRALYSDPRIGLVGPCSNYVSGPQQVAAGYDGLMGLDGFAWDWGKAHDGARVEVNRLVGFCLLIRRAVVDAIGLLDEQFEVGCFEDDDYCLRAIQAGYRAAIAQDAYIHHFGSRTFLGSGVDFGPIMRENERRYRAKWGLDDPTRSGSPPAPAVMAPPSRPSSLVLDGTHGPGLLLRRGRPRLSLCMIVRDSARTLPACLESIYPWVDEMVIVDTGSVDETPRIVESFGGRLFHFPWCDDFSAARNESLRHARGDWIFWMDSDDTIPPECGRQLRDLIDRAVEPSMLGYVMQVHCPGQGEDGDPMCDVTVVDHVKLFRNRPDLRFDGRIHEQILAAIRRAGGTIAWTELYVVHSGSDQSAAAQESKRRRDLRLLELELAERPEHPFTLFNLGMTYVHGSGFAEAVDYLRRSIARSGPAESHLRKAYALLVYAEMRLGLRAEALETCRRARELFPLDAELRFREGVLLHDLGRLEEARRAYLGVLEGREERHFASVDRGLTGFKARQNLAVVATDMGDLTEAERQWREVVRETPRYRPGWRGLGETLIRLGRFDEGQALADQLINDELLRIEGILLKHRIALARNRLEEARVEIDRAAAAHPDDLEVQRARCQFLFEHGTSDEAEEALRRLIARDPGDASAHHNLGTLLLRSRRLDEAEQAYRQSLRYRSDSLATYQHLAFALKGGGRDEEAAAAWRQVLRLSPDHPVAHTELQQLGSGR
jgi:GT2 family glycosyltransferase/tetratricopeptide (TPR) repeat protein/2-polyprenyl-3-methyl-5-hydroxy-6-metoxy-1,4-benzoquinol methylase